MQYLLDTHTFVWAVFKSKDLKKPAAAIIGDSSNVVYVSVVSLWEIQIKRGVGKMPHVTDDFLERFSSSSYYPLALESDHINKLADLPFHHRDPFDRMLVAQALAEKLTLITADQSLKKYGVKVLVA